MRSVLTLAVLAGTVSLAAPRADDGGVGDAARDWGRGLVGQYVDIQRARALRDVAGRDPGGGLRDLEALAVAGDSASALALSECYTAGECGVGPDPEEAARWGALAAGE